MKSGDSFVVIFVYIYKYCFFAVNKHCLKNVETKHHTPCKGHHLHPSTQETRTKRSSIKPGDKGTERRPLMRINVAQFHINSSKVILYVSILNQSKVTAQIKSHCTCV